MAVGDSSDILGRLKSVLPRWFGDSSPLLDALLKGLAQGHAFLYSLYVYAKMQTRIASASEGWLDMIAADFFGPNVLRAANQSDASYRAAIIANMFRERATRNAITLVLKALTGRAPVIVEPQRPADTGVYGASVQVSQPAVTSYVNPVTGLLTFVPPNTPRYQSGRLLMEAASTNLLTQSEFANGLADTGAHGGNVVASAFTGLTSTTGLHFTGGGVDTFAYKTNAGPAVIGTIYGLSVFVRMDDGLGPPVFGSGIATAASNDFALVIGGDALGPTAQVVQNMGGGLYRVSLTAAAQRAVANFGVVKFGSNSARTFTVSGYDLEIGGVSSYIPTEAAAVTRAADVLLNAGSGAGGAAYGSAGAYGSMLLPYQAFVTAFRPLASGVPNVAGYGVSSAGYGVASQGEYVSIASVTGAVQDADINAAIDAVKPAGTTLWTRISS